MEGTNHTRFLVHYSSYGCLRCGTSDLRYHRSKRGNLMFRNTRLAWLVLAVFLTADALLLLSVLTAPPAPLFLNAALVPTAEYLEQNPQSVLGFLLLTQSGMQCDLSVTIDPKPFAQGGVSADQLSSHLEENYRVMIDGVEVQSSRYIFISKLLGLSCEGNSSTGLTCWGGSITICYSANNLLPGLHLAEITVTDLDDVPHSYAWAFRIG
jgi:hypothetical protein